MGSAGAVNVDELRSRIAAFLQERFAAPEGVEDVSFSPFDVHQLQEARRLAQEFSSIAETAGVEGVLEAARGETGRRLPSVVKYALLLFLTHDPVGARVGAPSLEERHPAAVGSMIAARTERTGDDPESLSFFREDVYANDHHAHWHLVYTGDWRRQERQGEMFVYMHEQMLARYDAERLAVGRDPVEALDVDPPAVVEEGYNPRMRDFGPRPDRAPFGNANVYRDRREAFTAAIGEGFFESAYENQAYDDRFDPSGPQPALNLLASVMEAELIEEPNGDVAAPLGFAGANLHNSGHVALARLSTGDLGVMRDPSVAIRDPVFWRWHKLIDDVGAAWQDAQPERTFTDDEDRPPAVTIRGDAGDESPDLILCLRSQVGADFGDVAAGGAWATDVFGGERWDDDFSSTAPATGELATHMATRRWNGSIVTYLDFVDEFAYVVRVENPTGEPVDVTARIFIVPEAWSGDRRRWIEMDKALHTVPPGRSAIYRPSSLASVIRKPATRPPGPAPPQEGREPSSYCQCGWPYNLLLPRGTRDGMRFRLLVMLTDAGWDRAREERCGSMSFCGVRDAQYPDRRNMGYPFDRRIAGPGLVETLGALPNVGMRTFTIRWVD